MVDKQFEERLRAALDAAEIALEKGPYKSALRGLLALSFSEIQRSIPRASYADYSKLISVVEHASARNIAQATLASNIAALGKATVSIAELVPSLARILPKDRGLLQLRTRN